MDVDGLPWRPMTVSELLDASIAVLRRRPAQLLTVAVILAVVEQLALYPLRTGLVGGQHDYIRDLIGLQHHVWTVMAAGIGIEAFVIGILGAFAAGPARQLLLSSAGPTPLAPAMPASRRLVGAVVLSLLVGLGAFAAFWLGAVGWVFWFMLTALVTPVLVNDATLGSRGPAQPPGRLSVPAAFGRSFALVARSGMRPGAIRLMSYAIFTIIRLLIAWVGLQVLPAFIPLPVTAEYVIWVIVNATMYACIACGDAAAHLETRIRLEGLDIELSRANRLGTSTDDALAVPR